MAVGPKRPIVARGLSYDHLPFRHSLPPMPPTVWCGINHGWVPITEEQYKEFKTP